MADRPGLSGSDTFPPPLSRSIFVFPLVLPVSFSKTFSSLSPWTKSYYITCLLQTAFCFNIAVSVCVAGQTHCYEDVCGLVYVASRGGNRRVPRDMIRLRYMAHKDNIKIQGFCDNQYIAKR